MLFSAALMRIRVCSLSMAIVVVGSTGAQLFAASTGRGSIPIGTVLQISASRAGPELNSAGMTIYDGDQLETEGTTTLRALLHGLQLYLDPGTVTEVRGIPNGFSATLLRGSMIVSSHQAQTFELQSNDVIIHPASNEPTTARVTWVSSNELILSSNRGAIQVSLDGNTWLLQAGTSYRMLIESAGSVPQDNGGHGGPTAAGRNRRGVIVLISAAAATVGVVVWRAVLSPSAP